MKTDGGFDVDFRPQLTNPSLGGQLQHTQLAFTVFKIATTGPGEMAQLLGTPAALPEEQGSIPSAHRMAPNHL